MKTATIKLFGIDELPENIREKIVIHWRDGDDFYWLDEWEETLKAFFQYFSGVFNSHDWSWCSYRGGNISFEVCENLQGMKGARLFRYLGNNYSEILEKWDYCPLTGYGGDCDIMQPIADFMKRPSENIDLRDLVQDCFRSWCNGLEADYDHWQSEESILEDIRANEITFTEQGEVFAYVDNSGACQ